MSFADESCRCIGLENDCVDLVGMFGTDAFSCNLDVIIGGDSCVFDATFPAQSYAH